MVELERQRERARERDTDPLNQSASRHATPTYLLRCVAPKQKLFIFYITNKYKHICLYRQNEPGATPIRRVSCILICGRGKLSPVTVCFVLLCFGLLVREENCHMLRFPLHCFASLCIALLCFACIALLICGMTNNKPKACYKAC